MVDENEEQDAVAENDAQKDADDENERETEKVEENEGEVIAQAVKEEEKPDNLELKGGDEFNAEEDKIPIVCFPMHLLLYKNLEIIILMFRDRLLPAANVGKPTLLTLPI